MAIAPYGQLGCFQIESSIFSPLCRSADSIFGNLKTANKTASNARTIAKKYTYNLMTASCEADCAAALTVSPKIRRAPTNGKTAVPNELNAWVKFNLLDAVSGLPSTETYGFAATCNTVIPAARTMSAVKKNGKEGIFAAGYTSRHAAIMVLNPTMMARLYPIQSMILAAGREMMKYARKNAV